MAQLSMPFRIALVGLLVLSAVWFVVLRPGAVVEEPAAPLPGEALPAAVDGAQGAATASDARNGQTSDARATGDAAAAGATAAPATAAGAAAAAGTAAAADPATAAPAAAARDADPSARLLGALDEGRAVVLLFTDGRGADDREVRRAVAGVDRRAGAVAVRTVPLRDVGRYEAITRGVAVTASPTVLVLGPGRDAQAIVGLTTRREIGQAVGDALDVRDDPVAAARVARAAAVRRAERTCDGETACTTHFTAANDACVAAARQPQDAGAGAPSLTGLQGARAAAAGAAAAFAAVPVPAAQRAGHGRAAAVLQARVAAHDRALASAADAGQATRRLRGDAALRGSGRRLERLGYGACA